MQGEKITKHMSFSQQLDLTRFLFPQSSHHTPVPLKYNFVALVEHRGATINSGHYNAVAKTSTGSYYKFDDKLVHPISLSEVSDSNAYFILYEREPHVQTELSE
jgi:ubiquitin C-terminal hydrolase